VDSRARETTTKQKLALIFVSVFSVLLLAELAIRSSDALRGMGFFSQHRNQLSAAQNGVRPFRMFGVDHYHDIDDVRYISSRHGETFLLDKPAGTFRIVVFGGSSTENSYAFRRAEVHYPLVVQRLLKEKLQNKRIEVINVANSAYSTVHSIILLELDVLSWNPDLVILSHNINDLLVAYWPDFAFDYSGKYRHPLYLPDFRDKATLANVVFQQSQVYWVLKDRVNRVLPARDTDIKRRSYGFEIDGKVIDTFERNLRSFVSLATQNGIQVLLATQPLHSGEDYFIDHMAGKPYNNIVVYPLHQEFIAHHKAFNNMIANVSNETGAWFLNNNPVMDDRDELFIDYVHYSEAGVQTLAENYADFLTQKIQTEKLLH
jgi:lysophospholipase L1-like esterase